MVTVPARMQELKNDSSAGGVNGRRHPMVGSNLAFAVEGAGLVLHPSGEVRSETAGDDKSDQALGAFGIEPCELVETFGMTFQSRVHRAHDNSVGKRDRANPERPEQVR